MFVPVLIINWKNNIVHDTLINAANILKMNKSDYVVLPAWLSRH